MADSELVAETKFDYSILDKDEAGKLRCLARDLQKQKATIALSIMDIGRLLCAANEVLAKRGNGSFLKFVESEGFSKSSAYNYMAAFRVFGDVPNVGQMEDSALYALAQNETPEKARKEVLKLAEKGLKITHKQAKKIIKKHQSQGDEKAETVKPPKPPKPPKPAEPQLTKEEQMKAERKKAKSYAEYLQRSIDDLNRIVRSPMHPTLIKACGEILRGLEQW